MANEINIKDYLYDLPPDRIASHPLTTRDSSKLLFYHKGGIQHKSFSEIPDLLAVNTMLLFNDTRVIPARLHFEKETGARIEIFLLNPAESSMLMLQAMNLTGESSWICSVGNLKRWKKGVVLTSKVDEVKLEAKLIKRTEGVVHFSWTPSSLTFAEIVLKFGSTPLPPYIKRELDESDPERYQTIYSHFDGAVAAPTAGLHFSNNVFNRLEQKGIKTDFLTLHVSAGTFQPIKVENARDHVMHKEQLVARLSVIERLLKHEGNIIPVGTTAMRTIESIYWYGVNLLKKPNANLSFEMDQDLAYKAEGDLPSYKESLGCIVEMMRAHSITELAGHTSIFIRPGYIFRICNGLVTNFHLPGSTLILLVAALIGADWKKVYQSAMDNNYRFLSYGDSSLLLP